MNDPEPVWVTVSAVLAIHDEQLAEHGGQPGVRDLGFLESALARPRIGYSHGEQSLSVLAASLAFGITSNRPFIRGNKRTSLVVMELFLTLNGLSLVATDEACVVTFLALVVGDLPEDALAEWIRTHAI